MKINYVIGAFLCVLGCYGCSSPKTEVKSPDGHITVSYTHLTLPTNSRV